MRTAALLVALLLSAGARAEASDQVLISYEAKVGPRQISGVSHTLQWSATALGPESVQVLLRVPLDSFDSGHSEFDALLRSTLQSERHPYLEVAGVVRAGSFDGTLTLRGVSRPLQLRLGLVHLDEGFLVANANFTVDLADFGLVLPGAGRQIAVDFVGRFRDEPRAVISGGAVSSR